MKPVLAALIIFLFFSSCKNSGNTTASFCDTTCLKDSIKFTKAENRLKPYVYISAKNCMADTIVWSYSGMGVNRKLGLKDLLHTYVRLNKNYVDCIINDTSFSWVLFNDCSNGRGYLLKLPYNKSASIGRKTSAINRMDPKFYVENGLIAYTDRGNIFIEDAITGKTAMATFGKKADIDYDAIHESIDSVNVTRNRVWVKVKLDGEWQIIEKNISL